MTIPPLRIDEQRTDNPEGQVTYPERSGRPGYLPALAHQQDMRCVFIFACYTGIIADAVRNFKDQVALK